MEIIGIAMKQGEFEGRPYHKVKLHCKGSFNDEKNTLGEQVEMYSLDYTKCDNLFKHCGGSLKDLLGTDVKVLYNRYGRPDEVMIID